VATRYDKLAANDLAFIQLASIRLWLRVARVPHAVQRGTQPDGAAHAAQAVHRRCGTAQGTEFVRSRVCSASLALVALNRARENVLRCARDTMQHP